MTQYRITTADLPQSESEDDCLLSDADMELVKELSTPANKIGFDPNNPQPSKSTGSAEGT